MMIYLNRRTFPLTLVVSIADEPFTTGKLDSSKTGNRIVAKGFVTITPVNRVINNFVIVSFGPRELLVPWGRIKNIILDGFSDLIDLDALHNSPVGRSITL